MSKNNHPKTNISETYWTSFQLCDEDLDFLYNHLLELETPLTTAELIEALVQERITREQEKLEQEQSSAGEVFLPKNSYQVGQQLTFPALDYQTGSVIAVRPGVNPAAPPFNVMDVALDSGETRSFAYDVEDHVLNDPLSPLENDPLHDPKHVVKQFGKSLSASITKPLTENENLVQIAGRWFPQALLVDINIGYLNMAEALLEMEEGGPLSTHAILKQIELPTDVNEKLTEFSLNFALQEDPRFDEVGPAGETMWFLHQLEPAMVRETPIYLKHSEFEYDLENLQEFTEMLEEDVIDELQPENETCCEDEEVAVTLIFPHWQSGTLPLSDRIHRLFPTAYEAPRVQFTFIDADTDETFPGWVVRTDKYVYGLKEWYEQNELIPGSMVYIRRSDEPGKVIIRTEGKRSNREWMRTALIGSDGGIVFAMLEQIVPPGFNDRMAVVVPDTETLEEMWKNKTFQKKPFEKMIASIFQELAKLNQQGHVHALELYAAVNIVRRCPPIAILDALSKASWANHLGDLYFTMENPKQSGGAND
ncbi:MAG: hypothetical protein RBT34_03265 [Anaerolineaceae bacterium]|jgi:hypothetical protein|nr:hypothetical protein [Anaerolineaceae bacterium]